MKKSNLSIFLMLVMSLFISSCSTQTIALKRGFDFTQIKRVAVLSFKDPTYTQSEGSMVAELFVKYMLDLGYNVIERDQLDAILKEKQLSESSLVDPMTVRQLKLSGIDAIITGTITMSVAEREYTAGGFDQFVPAQVGLTCRMIDAGTGEILWAGSDTYDAVNTQTAFDYLTGSLVRDISKALGENVRSK